MNRLQKKCVIVSAGMHLSLLLILVIGPGFVPSKKSQLDDLPIIDFIPLKTTDAMVSNPGASASAPTQQRTATPATPTPPTPPNTQRKDNTPAVEKDQTPRIVPNLNRTVRNSNTPKPTTTATTTTT